MKYKSLIEKVIKKLLSGRKKLKSKSRKINIYINSLYGKFENAEHALNKIKEINQEKKPVILIYDYFIKEYQNE